MRARTVFVLGSVASGIATGAVMRRSRERATRTFYERARPESTIREVGSERLRLPLVFHRADGFWALFPADLGTVREELSSPSLRPVLTRDGRATFAIGAFRYHDGTYQLADETTAVIEPYAEVMMGPLVTRRPAPPMVEVSALLGRAFGLGIDIWHLPVTTRQARDGGIELWGLPKFVADMEFDESLVEQTVHLSEGGRPILDLSVRTGGSETIVRQPMSGFSVQDETLLMTAMPGFRRVQRRIGGTGAWLELGSHPIAEELRRLDLDPRPIASVTEIESRFFMGSGRPIGPASPRKRYVGTDRERGRYVVRHPGTDDIDQYARRPHEPAAPETVVASHGHGRRHAAETTPVG